MSEEVFSRPNGHYLNVEHIPVSGKPYIVYLHGLLSSLKSRKGQYLKAFAAEHGLSYLSFDFTAHGQSWGKPWDFSIGRCFEDAKDVIAHYCKTPAFIVGSSMGGLIGILLSEACPDKVAGYVGLAAGADFMDFIWNNKLLPEHKEALKNGAVLGPSDETSGYCFTYEMFEDARKYFILNRRVNFNGPVRLIQGDSDVLVPYPTVFKIKDVLTSSNVQIILIKGAGHALSEPAQLDAIGHTLKGLIDDTGLYRCTEYGAKQES